MIAKGIRFWLSTALLPLFTASYAFAGKCELEACPEFTLPVYCSKNIEGSFALGLDENFDLLFSAYFEGTVPWKALSFYVVDGEITPTGRNEARVKRLRCFERETYTECLGSISVERAERLEQRFNFDQSVINIALRKQDRDICIGKLTSNEEETLARDSTQRSYCTLTPSASYPEIEGNGWFDPASYGIDGEAHFHMSVTGLPTDEATAWCIDSSAELESDGASPKKKKKKFHKVGSSKAYNEDATDEQIYQNTTEEEQQRLEEEPHSYSLDFARELFPNTRKSLASINMQVSSSSASSAREKSNKQKKKAKRKKKREKRKRGKRNRRNLLIADDETPKVKRQKIFSWLNFDPLTDGPLYLAKDCRGEYVAEKAYARVDCSSENSDKQLCFPLSGSTAAKANVCLEMGEGFSKFFLRAKGLPSGEYSLCFNEHLSEYNFRVAGAIEESFGSLSLTDSELLASRTDYQYVDTATLESLQDVQVTSGSCSTALLAGSRE